jgi:ribosome maturation factor RimP
MEYLVYNELKDKIIELIESPLKNDGVELVDVKLSKYKNNTTLRLFVYSKNGTKLEECARISRFVGDLIDDTDYFESGYLLEVSSPGLDRPLKDVRDFYYRIGEKVKIEFVDNVKKKIKAEIVGVDNNIIHLKDKNGQFDVDMSEIEAGKIIF